MKTSYLQPTLFSNPANNMFIAGQYAGVTHPINCAEQTVRSSNGLAESANQYVSNLQCLSQNLLRSLGTTPLQTHNPLGLQGNPLDLQALALLTYPSIFAASAYLEQVSSVGVDTSKVDQEVPKTKRVRRKVARPKMCQVAGCKTQDKGGGLCAKHGGGRPCSFPGCAKRVAGTKFCSLHGGSRKRPCSFSGCSKGDQGGGFCASHGGGKKCKHKDCSKRAVGGGLCWSHGGGKRCTEPNCSKSPRRGGYCKIHNQYANHKGN